jgi:hypothetical protein
MTIKKDIELESLLSPEIDLVIQSGPLSEENERMVLDFIKKSKINRRRRERYAAKKTMNQDKKTPSVSTSF